MVLKMIYGWNKKVKLNGFGQNKNMDNYQGF